MSPNCVFVTGGSGAIGNHVVRCLSNHYKHSLIVNIDAHTYASTPIPQGTLPNYVEEECNICNCEAVLVLLRKYKPSVLIHLAAETHVDASFGNSYVFTVSNVLGTHSLLECCKEYGQLQRFIHMSTDEVYGSVEDDQSCHESSMLYPSNPYSASKAAAEMLCHAYIKSFNMPVIVMRCNNAVSLYQNDEKLIPRAIANLIEGKRVPVHGDGSAKRTFIYGDDIASAIITIAEKGTVGSIYNIGTDFEYTVLEVIELILTKIKGKKAVLEDHVLFVEDRPFQDLRYSVDTTSLRALGWEPLTSFNTAIELMLLDMKCDW